MDEPNIIAINPEAERELEMRKRAREEEKYCRRNHGFVELDEHTRTISCQDCGKVIDAFDYLWRRTMAGEHLLSGMAGINARIKIATAECADLERRVDNARASLKRAGEPQSQKDRLRFKNDMLNAEWKAKNPSIRII